VGKLNRDEFKSMLASLIDVEKSSKTETDQSTQAIERNTKATEVNVKQKKQGVDTTKKSTEETKKLKTEVEDLNKIIERQNRTIGEQNKKINELSESYKRLAENAKKFKNTQKEIADSTAKPFTINGSRAGVYGIDLAQTQLKKSSFYSEGKRGTYSQYDDVLSIQTVNNKIIELQTQFDKARQKINEAEKALSNLGSTMKASGMDEEAIKTNEEFSKLRKSLDLYISGVKRLRESNEKTKNAKAYSIELNQFGEIDKQLSKSLQSAEEYRKTLENVAHTTKDVFAELDKQGIDSAGFWFDHSSKKADIYRDSLGRVLKVTKEVNKEGETVLSYDISNRFDKLKDSAERTYEQINRLNKGLDNLKNTAETRTAADLKEEIDGIYERLQKLNTEITKAQSEGNVVQVNKLTKEYGKQQKELKKLAEEYKEVNAQIRNQGGWMLNLKDSWTKAMRSFTTYMSVTTVFYQGIHAIKSMVNEIKELDKTLTEFKKVSDLAGDSLERYVDKAYEAGDAVAKTGQEMIEAATSFRKSGYGDEMSLELSKVATMYTNIADEAVSAADSADFIIAQLKAFNLETKNATETLENAYHVIDAVNEVANNFAVSSADIARNLGKSSAVMANAGNSLEQMIGLMTAGTEITRNASKVANGLKTITLRLQGMNDEGEESLEVQAQMETLFNKMGISVYKAGGELKNTYEILESLAKVYPELTNAEKAYVTETIAGKFQAQNAAAILNNWKTAVEATETAMNSQGSAAKENARVLESIQGYIQKLNNEWEKLSKNLVKSDYIKGVLNLAIGALKALNSGIGQFVIKSTAATVAMRVSTQQLTKQIVKWKLQNLETKKAQKENNGLIASFKSLKEYIGYVTGKITLDTNKKKAQIAVNKALAGSQLALNLAFSAFSMILTGAITLYQSYQQKQQEMVDNALSAADSFNSAKSELDDYTESVQKYRDILANSASSEEQVTSATESLKEIKEKLVDIYGDEAKSLDLVNGSLEDQIDLIKKLSTTDADKYFSSNYSAITKAQRKTSSVAASTGTLVYNDVDESSRAVRDYINRFFKESGIQTKSGLGGVHITGEYDKVIKDLISYSQWIEKNKEQLISLGMTEEEYNKILTETSLSINSLEKRYQSYADVLKNAENILWNTAEGQEAVFKFIEAGKDGLDDSEIDAILEKYPTLAERVKILGITYDELREKYDELYQVEHAINEETETSIKKATDRDTILRQYSSTLDSLKAQYDSLTKAVEEYNEQGYLTEETLKTLTANGLLQYLDFQNGKLVANTKALEEMAEQTRITASEQLKQAMITDIENIANGDMANISGTAKAAIKGLGDETAIAANKASQATPHFITFAQAVDESNKALEGKSISSDISKKITAVQNAYKKAWNVLSKPIKLGGTSSRAGGGSGASAKSAWEIELENLNNQYKNSEITIEQYIVKLEALRDKYKKNADAVKELDKTIRDARFEKLEDDYKRGLITVEQYIQGLKELQKVYKEGTKEWNKYADSIKKGLEELLKDRSTNYKNAQNAAVSLLDKELDKLNDLKDETEKYYDDLIKAKEKANEETEKEIELAKLQEALENAKNNKTKRVYVQGLGWQWVADQQAIDEAQKALDDFTREQEIADLESQKEAAIQAIEDQIDNMKKYRDSWKEIVDGYEEEQNRLLLAQIMGANAENDILNQRLEVLEEFRDKYLAILRDLDMINNATADSISQDGVELSSGGSFANGGVVDYTGFAKVHGSASRPEVMLNNSQAAALYSMLKRPQFSALKFADGGSTQVYNFDNLVLPNVTNARQFLNELKTITNIRKNQ